MSYHERVTFAPFTSLPSAQKPDAIRERLKAEREAYRTAPAGSFTENVAQRNIDDLEEWLERAESNERLRTERIAALEAAEAAKVSAKRDADQAALETDLRRRYDIAMPKPVSDQEWNAVRESVMHRYRLKQMDEMDAAVEQARRSPAYRLL